MCYLSPVVLPILKIRALLEGSLASELHDWRIDLRRLAECLEEAFQVLLVHVRGHRGEEQLDVPLAAVVEP